MNEKIQKIVSIIKKDGLLCAIKKIIRYIKARYLSKINIFEYLYMIFNYKKIDKELNSIISASYDRIIIWRSSFGWKVPLFQRPQHISKNLALQDCLVLYEVTSVTDKVRTYEKIFKNLYLINFNNRLLKKRLLKKLLEIDKPKYIQIYSTDSTISVIELKRYIAKGFKVIYEYIDDLNPLLVGTQNLPKNLADKYNYMLKDTENIFVIVTADEIKKDVVKKRGTDKLVFACNGVEYEHFQNIENNFQFDKEFQKILDTKRPIIGYYGALASWFDYDLIKCLAEQRPNYNVVLFGIKYDNSFDNSDIKNVKNIYFLGSKDYNVLQNYANKFSVCTIPFLINTITKATSPVKLFEYMALSKPIVTTDMDECRKYKSVMISKTKEHFVSLIDNAIQMNKKNNLEYFELLHKEALENTWSSKAKNIINLLEKYEKRKNNKC